MPASWQSFARIPTFFPDGMTNTLCFVEKQSICNDGGSLWSHTQPDFWQPIFAAWSYDPPQVTPKRIDCDPRRPQTPFVGGLNAAMMDGSVRVLNRDLTGLTWWAACTPADGDLLGSDW